MEREGASRGGDPCDLIVSKLSSSSRTTPSQSSPIPPTGNHFNPPIQVTPSGRLLSQPLKRHSPHAPILLIYLQNQLSNGFNPSNKKKKGSRGQTGVKQGWTFVKVQKGCPAIRVNSLHPKSMELIKIFNVHTFFFDPSYINFFFNKHFHNVRDRICIYSK